jgi:hypothetical protein
MRIRRLLFILVASIGSGAFPVAVAAQATGDQSRLVLTVSLGAASGSRLWSSSPQAVQFITPADTFALVRRIRSTLAVGFGGAYFPGENIGVTMEGFLIGLGFENTCRHLFPSGAAEMVEACQSIQSRGGVATSVILSGGTIFRFNSRKLFSPYGRVNAGLVFSNQSSLRTTGQFVNTTLNEIQEVFVYTDDHSSRVDPALALGLGFTAAIAKGYNIRWEIRDNITGVQRVTGTIPIAGSVPPHERVFKHLFSMTLGFDVVLERRRGRRY